MYKFLTSLLIFLFSANQVFACTSFVLTADDGTVMVTRSMEFAQDMQSNIITKPRGTEFNLTAPNKKPSLSWTSKYGYIFLDGFDLGVPVDGMNEAGLSMEALLFPDEAEYQQIPEGKEQQALSYLHFGDWVLGNFKTVEEVRAALENTYVFAQTLPALQNQIFPLHYSVFDQSGKGIVIEYVKGKLNVYDHIGVMTNSPTYDWHTTNLRNYIQLSPTNPKPVVDKNITYTATGQGSGMIGLPGDISPPSRFVKMAVMLNTVLQPKTDKEALNLSQHVINNVDIPRGFVRVTEQNNTATNDLTQWVVFKDLKNKKLYYRTYDDLSLREIDLTQLNLTQQTTPTLKMPLTTTPQIQNLTNQLIATGK